MFSGANKVGALATSSIAAGLAGTADNCDCISRENALAELSAQYLMNNEKIFIFLKSRKEDHIFTDRGYIAVKGNTAGGLKRIVYRADFHVFSISNVMFETSGVGLTDQDCELKFTINGQHLSIDIKKSDQELGILYFRALSAVAASQARQTQQLAMFQQISRNTTVQISGLTEDGVRGLHEQQLTNALRVMDLLSPVSYASVLEQYIR